MPPRAPRSIPQLTKDAEVKMAPNEYAIRLWCQTASRLIDQSQEERLQGDDENAYIHLLRGVSIILEIIPKHPSFNSSGSTDSVYRELRRNLTRYMEMLETLRKKLNDRHTEWSSRQPQVPVQQPNAKPVASVESRQSPLLRRDSDSVMSVMKPESLVKPTSSSLSSKSKKPVTDKPRPLPQVPQGLDSKSTITVPELLAMLQQISQGSSLSVLILDVRQRDEFLSGHIRCRFQKDFVREDSGVVNVEPSWLHSGLTLSDLKSYLSARQYGRYLAERLDKFNMVVVHDANSMSWDSSHVLLNLRAAITESSLRSSPLLLTGGYFTWAKFVTNTSSPAEWIESEANDGSVNNAGAPLDGSRNVYDNSNRLPLQQSQSYSFGPQSLNAMRNAVAANIASKFDDPFMNFSDTQISYPKLNQNLPPASDFALSRSSSFHAPADYPSLPARSSSITKRHQIPPAVPPKPVFDGRQQPPPILNIPPPPPPQPPTLPPPPQQQFPDNRTALAAPNPPPPVRPQYLAKPPPPLPPKQRAITGTLDPSPTSSSPSAAVDYVSFSELGSDNIGVAGLKNLGNTCYMNSTLQCLSGTVPLARYFLGGYYRRHIVKHNPLGTKGVMVEEFAQVVKSMWGGSESVVAPRQFKHDSQEFLAFLLDSIHEDTNVARKVERKMKEPEDNENIPDDIRHEEAWRYYKRPTEVKAAMPYTSTTFNPFMYLSLPIPSVNSAGTKGGPVYLDDCLSKFVEPEILAGDDAWHCSSCKALRRTRKMLSICRLPSVLMIHLKRFYVQGPFKNKIETFVDFPVRGLDMSRYLPEIPGGYRDSYIYDLYAISNHSGSLHAGHYTANCKSKNQWYNFDDSRISHCDENMLKTSKAYILFYVRRSSAGPMTSDNWWH
ncbi:ubiquitin-specific protease doa4 [Blyttiomyces sp. JEL0837]|nr:ubiquitin-specific protease doa4 [Blyttiomyces sp. JEL0837]